MEGEEKRARGGIGTTHCGGVGGKQGGELKEGEDGRRPSMVLGLTFLLRKLFHKIV